MSDAENSKPAPGEYEALRAVLEQIEQGSPPIPLWSLSGAGLTAARLKTALHGLAVRGCIRASYKAGFPHEVLEVTPEAERLAAEWAAAWP